MLGTYFHDIAAQHGLTVCSDLAYGMLGGCFVTLSSGDDYHRVSLYVGPQEAPAPGYAESQTVSCARQIIHTITAASGAENHYSLLIGNEAVPALILNHAGSVVTVSFSAAQEAADGIQRFFSELLPQVAPLTSPQLCIYCAQSTNAVGCPVRLSADTVVPMHPACLKQAVTNHKRANPKPGSLRKGILGAALGALVGAVLWALLYQAGFIARVVGVLIGLLASWGYDLFKGRPGREKLLTVTLCSLLAVLLGSFAGSIVPFIQKYQTLGVTTHQIFAEHSSGMPVMLAYIRASIDVLGRNYWIELGKNALIGLGFTVVGCLDLLRQAPSATTDETLPRRLKGKC